MKRREFIVLIGREMEDFRMDEAHITDEQRLGPGSPSTENG